MPVSLSSYFYDRLTWSATLAIWRFCFAADVSFLLSLSQISEIPWPTITVLYRMLSGDLNLWHLRRFGLGAFPQKYGSPQTSKFQCSVRQICNWIAAISVMPKIHYTCFPVTSLLPTCCGLVSDMANKSATSHCNRIWEMTQQIFALSNLLWTCNGETGVMDFGLNATNYCQSVHNIANYYHPACVLLYLVNLGDSWLIQVYVANSR